MVKVNKEGVRSSLDDVGFGISQFLPIIVADLQIGDQSTLFVSQPEIHLHPSVQAEFGSYMVNQIKSAKKNYIIETHSEYLLNRMRLAIVKGEIPKDDVKVYYFQNDGVDVHTHCLEFTTDGRILNAPGDFFKTYQMDVMDIAMNSQPADEWKRIFGFSYHHQCHWRHQVQVIYNFSVEIEKEQGRSDTMTFH